MSAYLSCRVKSRHLFIAGGQGKKEKTIVRGSSTAVGMTSRHVVDACHDEESLFAHRRIDGFRFCSARRLETKNCFAFLHEIKTIARNRFQISRVSLEEIDLASLTREQTLLLVHLFLQVVDLRATLLQFFIGWNE